MRIHTHSERERALTVAASAMRRGDLVVVPTESMYAIATDAFSARGTSALRALKHTAAGVGLPVMVPSPTTLAGIATGVLGPTHDLVEAFWPGPLTLVVNAQPTLMWDIGERSRVSVRMPIHPFMLALLAVTGPAVVTGANLPGMEALRDPEACEEQLEDHVSVILDAGTLSAQMPASTVVDVTGETPVLLRHGGYSLEEIRAVCPDVVDGTR